MSETLIDKEFPGEDQEVEQENVKRIIYEVEEDSSALDVQAVKRGDYSKLDEVAAEDVLMDALNRVNGLGNAEDLEVFALIVLGGFDDFRHFAHATGAGGKPEVNEGNFVF